MTEVNVGRLDADERSESESDEGLPGIVIGMRYVGNGGTYIVEVVQMQVELPPAGANVRTARGTVLIAVYDRRRNHQDQHGEGNDQLSGQVRRAAAHANLMHVLLNAALGEPPGRPALAYFSLRAAPILAVRHRDAPAGMTAKG
jgi:hypothetical protein